MTDSVQSLVQFLSHCTAKVFTSEQKQHQEGCPECEQHNVWQVLSSECMREGCLAKSLVAARMLFGQVHY